MSYQPNVKFVVKSTLAQRVAEKTPQISAADVESAINQILQRMSHQLSEGGRIEIRGFGAFSLRYRPPRNAHNPKTGEKVATIEKYVPHFKPGKDLKDRVDKADFTEKDLA